MSSAAYAEFRIQTKTAYNQSGLYAVFYIKIYAENIYLQSNTKPSEQSFG